MGRSSKTLIVAVAAVAVLGAMALPAVAQTGMGTSQGTTGTGTGGTGTTGGTTTPGSATVDVNIGLVSPSSTPAPQFSGGSGSVPSDFTTEEEIPFTGGGETAIVLGSLATLAGGGVHVLLRRRRRTA